MFTFCGDVIVTLVLNPYSTWQCTREKKRYMTLCQTLTDGEPVLKDLQGQGWVEVYRQ